jgi:hypothetical protein
MRANNLAQKHRFSRPFCARTWTSPNAHLRAEKKSCKFFEQNHVFEKLAAQMQPLEPNFSEKHASSSTVDFTTHR